MRLKLKVLLLVVAVLFSVGPMGLAENEVKSKSGSFSKSDFDFDLEEDLAEDEFKAHDHLPLWNKACFKFNYWLIRKVIIPVSEQYKKHLPEKVRSKVTNFFYNLSGPVRAVNCVLQGKIDAGGNEVGRVVVNSTIGIFGIFDPAGKIFKLKTQKEDFGQTLGKWGVGTGTYLQLPFLGPRTLRDCLTFPIDNSLTLDSYFWPTNLWAKSAINGVETLDNSTNNLENLKSIEKDALDPYTYVRDAYLQFREGQIKD